MIGKCFAAVAFIFLAAARFFPLPLNAQALEQLHTSAAGSETTPPLPGAAAVYTAGAGFNVYFVNVGQGDAIYIELPGGQNALIDGGPSSSAAGPLAQFLASKNITKIDHVVLSHPHSDHYKGLQYVFSSLSVANFYDTRMDNTAATGDNTLRAKIGAQGVNLVYPAPGDQLSWGGVAVKVFNSCPEPVLSSNGDDINNCSITLKLAYQNASLLFTGDMEASVESSLVARFGGALKADVLKVGHHASAYSSSDAFLQAVHPARAYIEVGKNSYGHPSESARSRLLAVGARIFRSDLDGTQEYSPLQALFAGSVASFAR